MRALTVTGRLLCALAAVVILTAAVAGIPWLMATVVGWPLGWIGWPHPSDVPGLTDLHTAVTSPWTDEMILGLIASVGWVLWALFLRDVIAEALHATAAVTAARRGQPRPLVTGRGPLRWIAAVLIGAIAGAVLIDPIRATLATNSSSAAANAAARRPAVAATPQHLTTASGSSGAIPAGQRPTVTLNVDAATTMPAERTARHDAAGRVPAWATDAPGGVHHVTAGDNLWDIAQQHLGDPYRWREIYVLNRGHPQGNGYALTDPDVIHVGWVLALPARESLPATPTPQDHENPQTGDPGPAVTAPDTDHVPSPDTEIPPAVTATPPTGTPLTPSPPTGGSAETMTSSPNEVPAPANTHDERGITLPSQGWISLGLAATIAAVAALLRLHRCRRAHLTFPIPVRTGPQPSPVPADLRPADIAGSRRLDTDADADHVMPGVMPTPPPVAVPVGVDRDGNELSLFDLPGLGIALSGDGAEPAARAILASALATGALEASYVRPIVVTTAHLLARLLPDGAPVVGLDPTGRSFDGERLLIVADTAAAVTHAEEEMITRRRLLDGLDLDSVVVLNAGTHHAEHQPPYLLVVDADPRQAARITAVGTHRAALHLHPIVLGDLDELTPITVAADGTSRDEHSQVGRLATLAATDLVHLLAMVADAAPRVEDGTDLDQPTDAAADNLTPEAPAGGLEPFDIPTPSSDATALVNVNVLGPVTVTTAAGSITTGMRSGSYAALALLAAHPQGRTLDQIADALYPDTPLSTAANRVRTDITTTRRVLRAATATPEARFVVYTPATGRYRLDPDTVEVDLWQMLTALTHANTANDDAAVLTALREATTLYRADFADGQDRTWVNDYATTYRHQILAAYARIAEILETDHPDQGVAALERALDLDPINEELYQRIMRIHGRQHRPDAVRRTLRLLEDRLADLGDAEPSEATRRIAARQLQPTPAGAGR